MDEISTTIETASNASMSRRTIIKGAAWAVPAVIVLGATPAFAQTGTEPTPIISSVSLVGQRFKDTKGYASFTWTFQSNVALNSVGASPSISGFDVTNLSVTPTSGVGPFTATFQVDPGNSGWSKIPNFEITASYQGGSATFNVVGMDLPEDGVARTFSVS